jgi:hypothetical protein
MHKLLGKLRPRYVIPLIVLAGLGLTLLFWQRRQQKPAAQSLTMQHPSVLSLGVYAGCAIRADDTLACWSPSTRLSSHLNPPPEGAFASVSVGDDYACAIRLDGSLSCWGKGMTVTPPSGTFINVQVTLHKTCAVRTSGEAICWERFPGAYAARFPDDLGPVRQVITAFHYDCAIRVDDTLTCVPKTGSESVLPALPNERFRQISTGTWHSCGIRADNLLACWGGLNDFGEVITPAGTFTAVSPGEWHTCGIRTDATIACWGSNLYHQTESPAGTFVAISAGIFETCAIRTDGTLTCWGDDDGSIAEPGSGQLPAGPFKTNTK